MRRTSSTGTAAAPVNATRSDDTSYSARSVSDRIDWNNVGGPGRTVMRSFCTISTADRASNMLTGTIVAPCIRHTIHPAL